jgi:hypothetical protein
MFTEYLLPDKSPASTLNFAHVTCVAPAAKVSGGWQNRSDFPVDRKSSISQAHGTVVEGSDRRLHLRQILSSIRKTRDNAGTPSKSAQLYKKDDI